MLGCLQNEEKGCAGERKLDSRDVWLVVPVCHLTYVAEPVPGAAPVEAFGFPTGALTGAVPAAVPPRPELKEEEKRKKGSVSGLLTQLPLHPSSLSLVKNEQFKVLIFSIFLSF